MIDVIILIIVTLVGMYSYKTRRNFENKMEWQDEQISSLKKRIGHVNDKSE